MSAPAPCVSEVEPLIRAAGEGETLELFGTRICFKAVSAETAGAYCLIEYTMPGLRRGAVPHYHRRMTESFYILEGHIRFQIGEETREVGPGGLVVVPPGVVHSFENARAGRSRFLLQANPAGHERFFVELLDFIRQQGEWPPRDMAALIALGERHDTCYVKPPNAAAD